MSDDDFDEGEPGPEDPELDAEEPELDVDELDVALVEPVDGEVDNSGEALVEALLEGAVGVDPVIPDDDALLEDEEDGDEIVDLDEELHPDDVEEALDVVLRERTAKVGLEESDLDDEPDDRGEGSTRILPRRPGEFLCSSCFLVLPLHQLADEKTQRCRDCA